MWDNGYRVLVVTGGLRERAVASTLLWYLGTFEERNDNEFDLDIRYEPLTEEAANSSFRPNFFVGAVLGTRGGTSLLTIRTFASRCLQGKRGSLWEDDTSVDSPNDESIAFACENAVRTLFEAPGGIAWQAEYDRLWQEADGREAEATELRALWRQLPEYLRPTVLRLPGQ